MKREAAQVGNKQQQESTTKKKKDNQNDMESQVTLSEAKEQFNKLLKSLSKKDLEKFQNYVHDKSKPNPEHENNDNNKTHLSKSEKIRQVKMDIIKGAIIPELRKIIPLNGEEPGETIYIPKIEQYKGFEKHNTFHVDEFLYPDNDDIEELVANGSVAQAYCAQCKSTDIKDTNFISHSASLTQLEFIFSDEVLGDLEGKIVVDIGSRLGAMLYFGFLFTKAKELIGIEKSKFFCDAQEKIISLLKMSKRVKVINDDILNQKNVIASADVVIMNNVFEFFIPQESQPSIWEFVRSSFSKKGTLLVTIPSLEESLKSAGAKVKLDNWVKEIELPYPETDNEEEAENYQSVHLYQVK